MNPETPSPPSRFPILRRCVLILIALVTLILLFYAEENFRGKRAWNRYRTSAEARGVQFDFAALVPPPIPDEQNGANTPIIQSWFPKPKPDDTNRWPELFGQANGRLRLPNAEKTNNQDERRKTDFVSWQHAFVRTATPGRGDPAASIAFQKEFEELERSSEEQRKAALAILEELKIYEPALAELRTASQRPKVRFPVEYKIEEPFSILLPHLARIKAIVQELKLQTSAELAAGQTDRAFENLRLMLWLTEALKGEDFLISQLVRIACQQIATQPIWEGMMEHKWSEAQLKEIQDVMLRVNFAESLSKSMGDERAGGVAFIQLGIKRNNLGQMLEMIGPPEEPSDFIDSWTSDPTRKMVGRLTPRGWLYLEMLNHSRMMDQLIANGWDESGKVFHPQILDANEKAFNAQFRGGFEELFRHQVLARLLLPALTKASTKFARGQCTANQVALACALERYHKTHHSYPDSLIALVPTYMEKIPNETLSTNAMRYVRARDGYILYSVAWDGVDDGGALLAGKKTYEQKGDWVWRIGQ